MPELNIIVYGNCQSDALAYVLRSIDEIAATHRIIYLRSFDHPTEISTVANEEDWNSCQLFLEQRTSWASPLERSALPANAEHIQFPAVDFPILWPTLASGGDSRRKPVPGHDYGLYPYGDRLLNDILSEGHTSDEAWTLYRDRSAADLANYPRFVELEKRRWLKLDDATGIPAHQFILDTIADERAAWTYNHPTSRVLRFIFERTFQASDVLRRRLATSPREVLMTHLGHEPFDDFHTPIHPRVAEVLGLKWIQSDTTYRHFNYGSFDYETFLRRQIRWAA